MIAVLASSSINLLPDITVIPQLVVYLCAFFVLNKWVIQPALQILKRREELTTASEAASLEKQAELAKISAEIEARLKAERQSTLLAEEAKRVASEAETHKKIEEARRGAASFVEAERSKLQAEAAQVESTLNKDVAQLKQDIIKRVTHFEEVAS